VIYSLLRSAAGIALRWYYAEVTFVGVERIPGRGPILVVVNHPNALVDVLVAARAVPRQLRFTAKATLFTNPFTRLLFRSIGVLPLRRASDEAASGQPADPARNAQSFAAVAAALEQSAAILIFPEGKSHDEPALAPARTGAARMVIQARETRQVAGVRIVPVGLVFERKQQPRSRIVAMVGDPIEADPVIQAGGDAVAALTAAIDSALRRVTLNYSTVAEAQRDATVARTVEALIRFDAPAVTTGSDFRMRTEIARMLPALRESLNASEGSIGRRARELEASLLRLAHRLHAIRVSLDDFTIDRGVARGAAFVLRETAWFVLAAPLALWGWVNHLLPFNAALLAGKRARHSNADPAMRAIVAGAAFVLMMYMLQGAAVTLIAGPWWGLAYVVSLPITADVNLRTRDRLHRALRRARTWLLFRARPGLHDSLKDEARALRAEAISLAHAAGVAGIE
jgi:1-acyl-sn-glycerol-3-phosphate acyltransferase